MTSLLASSLPDPISTPIPFAQSPSSEQEKNKGEEDRPQEHYVSAYWRHGQENLSPGLLVKKNFTCFSELYVLEASNPTPGRAAAKGLLSRTAARHRLTTPIFPQFFNFFGLQRRNFTKPGNFFFVRFVLVCQFFVRLVLVCHFNFAKFELRQTQVDFETIFWHLLHVNSALGRNSKK